MKQLDITFKLLAYTGAATNDPANGDKVSNRTQESDIKDVSRNQIEVADATVDRVISLPDAACEYLVILGDRDISVKVNGGSAEALKTRANGKMTLMYFKRGAITSLSVSNASGATANVDILIANK